MKTQNGTQIKRIRLISVIMLISLISSISVPFPLSAAEKQFIPPLGAHDGATYAPRVTKDAGRVIEELLGAAPDDYRYYVDTGPVLERGWAARAGLGFRGKNGMVVSRRHGNWLFLAAILLRAEVAPDDPLRPGRPRPGGIEPAGLLCGKCTRCMDACPTAAFPAPGVVDSRRCVSYHTIENRGVIPREFAA